MDFGIVIVTYNRVKELEFALECYKNQTKTPKYVLVINNNSNDGTYKFLKKWENEDSDFDKYVINLDENLGGSGGFYNGLKEAIKLNADWIWLADDDAYPERDALENIEKFYENFADKNNLSAICGTVLNNRKIDVDHRRRLIFKSTRIIEEKVSEKEYDNKYFYINLFSYVGTAIKKDVLTSIGLTEKDYFIYYDDTEHSIRVNNYGKIVCLSNVRINHDINLQNREVISWKTYYGIRNRLYSYKKHFPKRYYYYEYIRFRLKIINSKDIVYKNILKEALKDCKKGVLGTNNIYKPGWKG